MFCFVLVFFYINSLLLKYRKKKEKTTIINVVVEFGVFFCRNIHNVGGVSL